ncbi:MAG: FIST C-terminal domain-containing protein [Nitrospira sp.]|nr:FIST C-terminal domain-containing protein [Nitrospira sp.]MCP9456117.1 FIST C-terminal domain-containing protein [Nitrospira sp.]
MPSLQSSSPSRRSGLRFAAALSKRSDTEAAACDLADEIRSKLETAPIDLACLFFSAHHVRRAARLASTIHRLLSPRLLIGCSGEGVIAGTEELETIPAVALWAASLPGVTSVPVRLSFSPLQDRFRLQEWPESDESSSALLLLADPLTLPMQEALKFLAQRYPDVMAIGGLAGGGSESGENRLILQGEALTGGLVGVRFSGSLDIRPVISQGCRLVGERFVVTKAEHNRIHELGGVPALERLRDLLESMSEEEREQAKSALHIGIAVDEYRDHFKRGDFLIRHLIGVDQEAGSLMIGDLVREGQTVQFQLRDARSAGEDLKALLDTDRLGHRQAPLGALLFSCCGRGRGLFGKPHHDARTVADRLGGIPVAGFFAQGEIGPVGRHNVLHSYTASMAIFAEPERRAPIGGRLYEEQRMS